VKYMLLIYSEPWDAMPSEAEQQAELAKWFQYTTDLQEAGVYIAGDALREVATATSVRVREGKTLTTDGPFAETKEILGGYYLVDVPSLDEALTWAERCPGAVYGTIEVRPLMVFDGPNAPA
jgi:hypothetical protein